MATSAQLDRRKLARHNRVLRACDSCRHSHVKCDAAKPTCKRCKQTNKVCCYTLPEPEVKQVKKYISIPTPTTYTHTLLLGVDFISPKGRNTLLTTSSISRRQGSKLSVLKGRLKRVEDLLEMVSPALARDLNSLNQMRDEKRMLSDISWSEEEDEVDLRHGSDVGGSPHYMETDSESGSEEHTDSHASSKKSPPAQELTFGVPPAVGKVPTELNLGNRGRALTEQATDIIAATITKTSDTVFMSDTPFMLCTPPGLKWLSEKIQDPIMLSQATSFMSDTHLASFRMFSNAAIESARPKQFSLEVLVICATEFKACMKFLGVLSDDEVDMLVASEINPPKDPAKANGYAEKMALHCIVALGLMSIYDRPETRLTLPVKYNTKEISSQVNSAYYYFFRYALIGNSPMGIKAVALLVVSLSFSFSHGPALVVSATAVRLAQASGLHLKQYTDRFPPLEVERQRRLWWVIYGLEKMVTMKFGKPSSILDECISTPLPSYHAKLDDNFGGLEFCIKRSFAQLYQIWAKVYRVLFSPGLNVPSKAKLISLVQLDTELQNWARSLPPTFRPGVGTGTEYLKSGKSLTDKEKLHLKFYVVNCHCSYHFIRITIFRNIAFHPGWIYRVLQGAKPLDSETDNTPAGADLVMGPLIANKTKVLSGDQQTWVEKYNGVKLITKKVATDNPILLRSFQIAVDMSRQTLRSLAQLKGSQYMFFAMSVFNLNAFITLLIKCMMLPGDSDTKQDFELMDVAIHLFRDLRVFKELVSPQSSELLVILKEAIVRYVAKKQGTTADGPIPEQPATANSTPAATPPASHVPSTPTPAMPYSTPQPAPVPPYSMFGMQPMQSPIGAPFLHPHLQQPQQQQQHVNANPEFMHPPPPHTAPPSTTGPQQDGAMSFESILMAPNFPDDPYIFDSLYQLSSVWGNFDAPPGCDLFPEYVCPEMPLQPGVDDYTDNHST